MPPPGFDELPPEEKLDYVQELWDRMAARPEDVIVPEWQKEIVRERLAAHRRGEGQSIPWTEVRKELQVLLQTSKR